MLLWIMHYQHPLKWGYETALNQKGHLLTSSAAYVIEINANELEVQENQESHKCDTSMYKYSKTTHTPKGPL